MNEYCDFCDANLSIYSYSHTLPTHEIVCIDCQELMARSFRLSLDSIRGRQLLDYLIMEWSLYGKENTIR